MLTSFNRDENTHLWLFRNIIKALREEAPELFTDDLIKMYREMIKEGCEQEIAWGHYAIGDDVEGIVHEVIKKPDMILIDHKNDNSILVLGKSFENSVNVVVRLSNTDFDNSIITAMRVSDKTLKRLLKKNKKIYDKNE